MLHPRLGILRGGTEVQGEEEEGRTEDVRRANTEAMEEHGKAMYENSEEPQMEVPSE